MSFAARRLSTLLLFSSACLPATAGQAQELTAFVGARIIDGTTTVAVEDGVLLVQDGRIVAVGARASINIPAQATQVAMPGKTLMPGMVNAHGHAADDALNKLGVYARYGVTTVLSLGGENAGHLPLRDERAARNPAGARLLLAGPIPNPSGIPAAQRAVENLAALGVDWVKIRVERNSLAPEVYGAMITSAHAKGLPLAAHMYDLQTTRGLLEAGVDMLAHSVRDQAIDTDTLALMTDNSVCLSPTLMREVSTYVYAETPDFFSDPFFLQAVDPAELQALSSGESQQRAAGSRQRGQADLAMAQHNLGLAWEAGVRIAMGTDSGAFSGRFPGYFEHLELELMEEAGMSREAVLQAATSVAAECIGVGDEVGSLRPGLRADFIVLDANPLEDLRNTRRIDSVWMDGKRL